MTEPEVVTDATEFPLASLAALGGRPITNESAVAAISARMQTADGLAAMRSVPLRLIDAIEPMHHASLLAGFSSNQTKGAST